MKQISEPSTTQSSGLLSQILFPMRKFDSDSNSRSYSKSPTSSDILNVISSDSSDDFNTGTHPTKNSHNTDHDCNEHKLSDNPKSKVQWIGMTPIEMVEQITNMVGHNLDLNCSGEKTKVIPYNCSSSSFESCFLDMRQNHGKQMNHHQPFAENQVTESNEDNNEKCCDLESLFGQPYPQLNKSSILGKRKNRDESNQDHGYENGNIAPGNKPHIDRKVISWCLNEYKCLSKLCASKFGNNDLEKVERLQSLIHTFEGLNYHTFISSYNRVRQHFELVLYDYEKNYNEVNDSILQELYQTTEQQLNELIKMAKQLETTKNFQNDGYATPPLQLFQPYVSASYEKSNINTTKNIALEMSTTKKKNLTKKEFAKYMSSWLKENWTNPYPDDEGLVDIANECGMTSKEVGNWLINARTRKWRPAIVKAFGMGRPASLLKEDAIRIFEGKSVREI